MPELPEVEVIRRGLLPHLQGQEIVSFRHSGKALRTPVPTDQLRKYLSGAVIENVERRAKYLLLPTDKGDLLIFHLGMTGKLGIFPKDTPDAKHDHLFFLLQNGMELRFHDVRRFGSVSFIEDASNVDLEESFFHTSGPEPFSEECTSAYFKKRAKGSSQAIKTFIMNSKIVVGVGNIYANESLFAAGIHPQTPAGRLTHKQWNTLIIKIREILNWAIECGGSTISDFLDASGQSGYFQVNFKVYGRNDQPCPNCSTLISRKVINGRASFFCKSCQKR